LIGHVGSVISVDWSPDGSKIVSGGVDNTVRIWDSTSGAILATFQDFTDAIFAVSWSADGNYIATGEIDLIGTVRVLQVDTGEIFDEIQTNLGPILDVEWSPDGSKLLFWGRDSGSPQQLISIVEATIKEDRENAPIPQAQQMTPQQETVYEIVRSGNGQVLAVNYYYVAIVDFFDAATGDMIHKAELPQTPILMTLSPTGDRLLWIDSRTNIYLYDTVTGANSVLFSLGEGEGRSIGPIAWNPVNDFVAIAAGSYADIYDVSNGTLSPSTSGATLIVSDAHRIVNLSWSPEGTRLATSHFFKSQLGSLGATLGAPEEASAIQVWDLAPGVIQTIPILKIDDRGGGNVSWSPDGARLAMLESGELLIYYFVARQVEADLQFDEEYPADVVWSPNVQFLAMLALQVAICFCVWCEDDAGYLCKLPPGIISKYLLSLDNL
jgi:WD40 repeat protein